MVWPKGLKRSQVNERYLGGDFSAKYDCGVEIDEELVEKLAQIQCTDSEIAAVIGCSVDTIARRCAHLTKMARERGKASLRRRQYLKAVEDGDNTALIWLGKVYLGQFESREAALDVDAIQPLVAALKEAFAPPDASKERVSAKDHTDQEERS